MTVILCSVATAWTRFKPLSYIEPKIVLFVLNIKSNFTSLSLVSVFAAEDKHELFVVFHDEGYTVYEPNHCHIEHQVSGSFSNFRMFPEYGGTPVTMCPEDEDCSWGAAVNVQNRLLYVTQPRLNRVVVIELMDRFNPVEVSIGAIE